MIEDYSENVPRTMLRGSSNWERLQDTKGEKSLSKIFGSLDTDDLNMSKAAYDRKEAVSDDPRLMENDIVGYQHYLRGHDMLLRDKFKRRRSNLYQYQDPMVQRVRLRELSSIQDVNNVITKLSDEVVVINDEENSNFMSFFVDEVKLKELKLRDSVIRKIKRSVDSYEYNIMRFLGMTGEYAWAKFYRFAVDGSMAWEIIFDNPDKPKRVIGANPLDPLMLKESYKKGTRKWVYYETDPISGRRTTRIFHDHQIVKIDWRDTCPNGRTSFMEQIMKPYHMMRIVKEAKLTFAVTHATFRTLMSFPSNGEASKRAAQSLSEQIEQHTDDVHFDSISGELQYNGSPNIPFMKQMFVSEMDGGGSPKFEAVNGSGAPNLLELERDRYFTNDFIDSSGIPRSRFTTEEGSSTWSMDAEATQRLEMAFGRQIKRIRKVFIRPILTMMHMQVLMDVPEIRGDARVINCVRPNYTRIDHFDEMAKYALEERRLETIERRQTAMTEMDEDGNERPYYPVEYLAKTIMKHSDEELEVIEGLRKKGRERMYRNIKAEKEFIEKIGLSDYFNDVEAGGGEEPPKTVKDEDKAEDKDEDVAGEDSKDTKDKDVDKDGDGKVDPDKIEVDA